MSSVIEVEFHSISYKISKPHLLSWEWSAQ